MGCKTYDDLLLVSQRLGSGGKVSASALLAAAAKLKIPPRLRRDREREWDFSRGYDG